MWWETSKRANRTQTHVPQKYDPWDVDREHVWQKLLICFDKWNPSWREKDYHHPVTPDTRTRSNAEVMSNWQGDTKMQISPESCVAPVHLSVSHNSFITKITTNKWISALPSQQEWKNISAIEFCERSWRVYYSQYINNILSAIKHFSNT